MDVPPAELGPLAAPFEEILGNLVRADTVARIWASDHTVWADEPTEIADRLGWLHILEPMAEEWPNVDRYGADLAEAGFTDVLLMGMGGSSMFPEVLAKTFPSERCRVHVLDTTQPAAITRLDRDLPRDTTLYVAASKSGTTLETRSHLAHFSERVTRPEQFLTITDPGSALASLGADRGFPPGFENPSDIGGRFSALSYFGLVPAALMGADGQALLESAIGVLDRLSKPDDNPGLSLGAVLAAGVREGRDKLTLVLDPRIVAFGAWLEQLVAESTGKAGTGVVPVVGEPLTDPAAYGDDRLFVAIGDVGGGHGAQLDALAAAGHPVVRLPLTETTDLGAQVIVWEFATAVCGAALRINPFDQPDVASAKAATRQVLAEGLPIIQPTPLSRLVDKIQPGDYVALCGFVDPAADVVDTLGQVRVALRDSLGVATTVGLGPRFLHSTGQLHKGGPRSVVVAQIVRDAFEDVPIPDQDFGFATLSQAQAAGDLNVLKHRKRRAGRVRIEDLADLL